MPTIKIDVKNKIASQLGDEIIVCYNKDYVVEFTFDKEWENENIKTAIFTCNGNSEEVVFEGNSCEIPMMVKATELEIGVYSGDLRTSTSAKVYCYLSALDKKGLPKDPTNDVYAQIIDLLNKYIEQGGSGGISREEVERIIGEYLTENPPQVNLSEYQKSTDDTLETESKEVVGAINELNSGKVGLTDYATNEKFGLVRLFKTSSHTGLAFREDFGGALVVAPATEVYINIRDGAAPITPRNLDYALKVGLTTNSKTLTEEEQASALTWLGAKKYYNHLVSFTCSTNDLGAICNFNFSVLLSDSRSMVDILGVGDTAKTIKLNEIATLIIVGDDDEIEEHTCIVTEIKGGPGTYQNSIKFIYNGTTYTFDNVYDISDTVVEV